MDHADVIIVGAGIAGAAMACELQAYADVLLLERDATLAERTSRSGALFAPAYGPRVIRALTRASRKVYEDRLGHLSEHRLLIPRGAMLIAREDQQDSLEAFRAEPRDGAPLQLFEADELARRLPFLRPGYAVRGAFDPDVMDLDAAAVHQAHLAGFERKGGRLVTRAEALEVADLSGTWRVRTPTGDFEAPMLVDAAGARADDLARLAGVWPLDLVRRRRTAFLFEPPEPLPPETPVVDDVDETFYFRPQGEHVLGSPADASPVAPTVDRADPADIRETLNRIERAVRFRVNRLLDCWADLHTSSPDDRPVVGMDEIVPGFFWLAGHGSYGPQTAPALGRMAASLLVDGVVPDDLLAHGITAESVAPLRFRTTPGSGAPESL